MSTYPEWIAQYMLEQNNGYYPLPVSISNVLAYLFPATAQAYWDEVLEHAFAAKLDNIKKYPQKHPQNPYTVPELCGGWEGTLAGMLVLRRALLSLCWLTMTRVNSYASSLPALRT